MEKLGYHCDVIAPSLIPCKPGDKRKNDHRFQKFAENYAKGLLTVVHPPTEFEESIRGLVRCHLTMNRNMKIDIGKEIENITAQIFQKYNPDKIILFGSAAIGNLHSDSDADFLIIKQDTPLFTWFHLMSERFQALPTVRRR